MSDLWPFQLKPVAVRCGTCIYFMPRHLHEKQVPDREVWEGFCRRYPAEMLPGPAATGEGRRTLEHAVACRTHSEDFCGEWCGSWQAKL